MVYSQVFGVPVRIGAHKLDEDEDRRPTNFGT